MIRNNHSKISCKESVTHYQEHRRGRSSSAKSNQYSSHKKANPSRTNSKIYEKVLTQTTSSKLKRSRQHSPGKSMSNGKKDKMQHLLSDKISTKSMRKGRLGK